jgi:hypothetical protein
MQSTLDQIRNLADTAKGLAETKAEILKLKAIKQVSKSISNLLIILFVAILVILAIILLSISLSIWIGNMVDSLSLGFLIVGGIYLVLGLILLALRKKSLAPPITNSLIEKMAN